MQLYCIVFSGIVQSVCHVTVSYGNSVFCGCIYSLQYVWKLFYGYMEIQNFDFIV